MSFLFSNLVPFAGGVVAGAVFTLFFVKHNAKTAAAFTAAIDAEVKKVSGGKVG